MPTRRQFLIAGGAALASAAAIGVYTRQIEPHWVELVRRPATLVLYHNPDVVDEPVWLDVQAWVLAGHTHGGQSKPPFLPPPMLPVRNRRYTAGAFSVAPGRTLYINRRLGHLIQVRCNVRPEITLFTLERATGHGHA